MRIINSAYADLNTIHEITIYHIFVRWVYTSPILWSSVELTIQISKIVRLFLKNAVLAGSIVDTNIKVGILIKM